MPKRAMCMTMLLLAIACDDGPGSGPELPRVESISVSLGQPVLRAGRTTLATASGVDQFGKPIALPGLKWTSSTPFTTVNDSGRVTAVATGQSAILATLDGKVGQATMYIFPPAELFLFYMDAPRPLAVGASAQVALYGRDQDGQSIEVTPVQWSLRVIASGRVTIDSTGRITGVTPGDIMVRATSHGITSELLVKVVP